MLDHTANLRKVRLLMHAKRCGDIEACGLYAGLSVISIADYQHSNTDSKFGYLMRHPTSSNQIGKDVSEAVIHSAQFALTAAITPWLTGYGEFLYDPQQSFGSGTITSLSRNQIQLRKGYALLGNLDCWPVYMALGKMDTPFGQTYTVNPFTSNTVWHAFGGLVYGALFGYDCNNLNINLMAVQGGAQFRALNAPVRDTAVPSRLNNFAGDINYTFDYCNACITLGASYKHSSAYVQDFPVQHFAAGRDTNPAWSVYGTVHYCDWTVKGSYVTTTKVWPGTFNPNPPLNVFPAHKTEAFDAGAKWKFMECKCWDYFASAEFSRFIAGPSGAPWERQDQTVLGLAALYCESSKFFLEGFFTKGFVPLNFISGGGPVPVTETHSVRDAESFGIIVGAQISM
jgi:hypothetical protein